jgi:hypothetical protein
MLHGGPDGAPHSPTPRSPSTRAFCGAGFSLDISAADVADLAAFAHYSALHSLLGSANL